VQLRIYNGVSNNTYNKTFYTGKKAIYSKWLDEKCFIEGYMIAPPIGNNKNRNHCNIRMCCSRNISY